MTQLLNKINIFAPHRKIISRAEDFARETERLENNYLALTDEQLKEQTASLKVRFNAGATLDSLLPEAFSIVREMSKRVHGMRAYYVQLVGAAVVHMGDFAEMATGEGKTLTLLFPIFLNSLSGKGVHVVSVNEYLVERDAHFCRLVLEKLGLTVGFNLASHPPFIKRAMYACDVTYTTNSELGFDYLRDNMAVKIEEKVQRGLDYAIVDEGDSVLIDEARTPLIISGGQSHEASVYTIADQCVKSMQPNHFYIDRETRAISLTPEGVKFAEDFLKIKNLYDFANSEMILRLNNALIANHVFMTGVEYIVREGKIMLVDQSTGRVMDGRSYSNGLNQAIQAKEHVEIEPENSTIATITYQSFFRLYTKLAAVSGTAFTESEEFMKIYNMVVVPVPRNKPLLRADLGDKIYATRTSKWKAAVIELRQRYESGQPVLVGTGSVEDSELLSSLLQQEGIPHEVLNARNNAREAEIIANAGHQKAITISTNMAGRGTDIKLGPGVIELGGLFVLGTNRHESRRIDNQLRGRSGRQGDVGSSQFFISVNDELFKRFGREKLQGSLDDLGDNFIQSKFWTRAITGAQKRIEHLHFDSRKNLMDYDQVLAEQRELIYKQRDAVLRLNDNLTIFESVIRRVCADLAKTNVVAASPNIVDAEALAAAAGSIFVLHDLTSSTFTNKPIAEAAVLLTAHVVDHFRRRHESLPSEIVTTVIRNIMIRTIDDFWQRHIDQMLKLREGVQLRAMEQVNPLDIYVSDGHKLFERMAQLIAHTSATAMMTARIEMRLERPKVELEAAARAEASDREHLIEEAQAVVEEEFKDEKGIGLDPNEQLTLQPMPLNAENMEQLINELQQKVLKQQTQDPPPPVAEKPDLTDEQ